MIKSVTTWCRTISTISNTISTRGWSISLYGKRVISCVHNIWANEWTLRCMCAVTACSAVMCYFRLIHQHVQLIWTCALTDKASLLPCLVWQHDNLHLSPVTICCWQFAIPLVTEGVKLFLLLHCLQLTCPHHVQEWYDQLTTHAISQRYESVDMWRKNKIDLCITTRNIWDQLYICNTTVWLKGAYVLNYFVLDKVKNKKVL